MHCRWINAIVDGIHSDQVAACKHVGTSACAACHCGKEVNSVACKGSDDHSVSDNLCCIGFDHAEFRAERGAMAVVILEMSCPTNQYALQPQCLWNLWIHDLLAAEHSRCIRADMIVHVHTWQCNLP